MNTRFFGSNLYLILSGNESAEVQSLCQQWVERHNPEVTTKYEDETGRCEDTGKIYELTGDSIEGTAYRIKYSNIVVDEAHLITRYDNALRVISDENRVGGERMGLIFVKVMQEQAEKLIQAGYAV